MSQAALWVRRARIEVDVTGVAPEGVRRVVGDLYVAGDRAARASAPAGPLVMALPGGGMTRGYFDLEVPEVVGDYRMAPYLAARGAVVVTVDHPGTGDSDRPVDGYALTPRRLADVHAHVHRAVRAGLADGSLAPGVGPVAVTASFGLAHSAGASITVHQQARHRSHDALVLLGYAGGGLPSHLEPAEEALAGDPVTLAARAPELAAARYGDPLPMQRRGSSTLLVGAPLPPAVHEALVACRTNLLAVVGLSSMVPGNADPELAAIDVPVLLGVGDRDITGAPHRIPASFPASRDVTLYVLEDAGHNHNVAPTRHRLWHRVAAWMGTAVGPPAGDEGARTGRPDLL